MYSIIWYQRVNYVYFIIERIDETSRMGPEKKVFEHGHVQWLEIIRSFFCSKIYRFYLDYLFFFIIIGQKICRLEKKY